MQLEEKFVKLDLKEENHLAVIFNSSFYRGWYRFFIETEEAGKEFKDIIVRFRMPPAIPLYKDVLRNFSSDERVLGIHRLLKGKDLREETEAMLNFDNIADFVKTLNDTEVKELLGRMKHMVTLDCNRVPYLHIRKRKEDSLDDVDVKIKDFVKKHPDYLRMFYDVLNENISIKEASLYSHRVIYNELEELNHK